MKLRTATAAATALATAALVVPAPAVAAPLLAAPDERRDVRITSVDGLSNKARRSIDIHTLRVVERDDGKIRFTFAVKDIIRRPKFDQMFFLALTPPASSDASWQGDIGFTSKGPYSYASIYDEDTDALTWCDLGHAVTRRPAKDRVSLVVPPRCVPGDEARVRGYSATGHFRTDAPPWSRDRLRVPGTHDLKP